MVVRNAKAEWNRNLKEGKGSVQFGGTEMPYSFKSRFEDGKGTNPEELIGAAHAGCFSMALAHALSEAGHEPTSVRTSAKVHLDSEKLAITEIVLRTEGDVPGLDEDSFADYAEQAKKNCPVSKALAGVEITLKEAVLV